MLSLVGGAFSSFSLSAPVAPQQVRAPAVRMEAVMDPPAEEVDFKGAEAWSAQIAHPEAVFDILAIKDVLPHRYPFLLVDKVIEFVPGKKAVGLKTVTTNEEL